MKKTCSCDREKLLIFEAEGQEFANTFSLEQIIPTHTTYSRHNMGQKCEGNCGLWVLNEII